jgi:hypothetical protein
MDTSTAAASSALCAASAAATMPAPLDAVAAATGTRTTSHITPDATAAIASAASASAHAAGLLPSSLYGDLGLPGYPASMGDLSALAAPGTLSPTGFSRQLPPGFTTPRLPIAHTTWTPLCVVTPSTNYALVVAITTI